MVNTMKSKTDLRVIKTKRAIYDAFIQLMNQKGLASMTVQDILDEALINRKTFYTYYHDKYDLAEQIANDFLNRLDQLLSQRFLSGVFQKPDSFLIDEIYSELTENKKEFLAIWNIRTDRIDVLEEISERLQKVYHHLASTYNIPGDRTLQSFMFSTFVMTSYQYIMKTDQTFKTNQLLKEYQNLYDVIEKASQS